MKKIMLIGKVGCGKTSLNQALHQQDIDYKKTQAILYNDNVIDTPGEFVENRRFYSALLVTANQCDIVGMVQDAVSSTSMYPPGFSSIFSRPVIGIVSKIDLGGDPDQAASFLRRAGARTIIKTSAVNGEGVEEIRKILKEG